jgi:hypothetical protein
MIFSVSQLIVISAVSAVLSLGCNISAQKEPTVKNYRMDKPEKFFMPESLLEISGITFYKERMIRCMPSR